MQNLVFKSQTIIPVIVNNLPYLIERQNSVVRENRTTENNIRSAVRQELAALASESATDTNVQDMRNLIAALMNNIIDGRVKNQYRHLVDENAALKEKLAAIKKAVA